MRFMIIFCFLLLFNFQSYANSNKNILILNSYHKGFSKSDEIIRNIEKTFFPYSQINTDILYMDSMQIYSRDYIKELSELYKIQLQNRKYDLIITIDKFAYLFAVKNHSIIFKGEPILFAGLENYSKELIKIYNLDNKVNGLIEKLPIASNIKLIENMIPNLKKLYILNDRSINGDETSFSIRKEIQKIKNKYEIEYLRDNNLSEFIDYFKEFKKDEAILFVRYSRNPNGNFYKDNELITAINNFQKPVFVLDDLFLNKGTVGGKVLPLDNTGKRVGNMAIDIIYENVSTPNFEENQLYTYIFDYNLLKKFNLQVPKSLNNVKIINEPKDFFDKNRELINYVFLATPFLVLVIFGLIKILYDKQQNAKKLKQRIEFDKILLNSIDNPIFWEDYNGVILDSNEKFCEIIDLKYSQLLGNTLNQYYHSNKNVKRIVDFLEKNESENDEKKSKIFISKKEKERRVYLLNKRKYLDPNTNEFAVVTIFTDITKEKEIEEEKSKQTQYLIQQSKLAEIGEIFSSIAHQWKSPLVEITALAQDLFYSQNRSEKEEDSYHINNIMTQVQYMTKTINDFQDFIIPSSKKTTFELKSILSDLLNIVKHNMKYNYVSVNINNTNSSLKIYGFQNEFMQALLNIINNAKEALLKNSEKDRFINIDIKRKLGYIAIDISDNGLGIADDKIDKIFLQYYSTKKKGHGIGLYMTKLIIEDKLDGRIKYIKKDFGSCFRVIIKESYESFSS